MKTAIQKSNQGTSIFPQMRKSLFEPFSFMEPYLWDKDLLSDWLPKVDIAEDDKEMSIKVSVPGVKPEDIKLEVDDHSLTIQGQTESEKEEEGKTWYRRECECGSFSRTLLLPADADANSISAKSKNGTLLITVPKNKVSSKKKIPIE